MKDSKAQPAKKQSNRHVFTREECQRGFWNAITSIVTRYPDAIMPDGRHIACNFLRRKGATV
jgi:hypothetical protein